MNKIRYELGLPALNLNWYIEKNKEINKRYKVFNQEWKNTDTISIHKHKEVIYRKSFLIWKNEVIQEIDSYSQYISESEYELREFRLDRILQIVPLNKNFEKQNFSLSDYFIQISKKIS